MSSASGTTRRCLTRKNTSSNDTAARRIDEDNQVVYCVKCNFVAPMSLSFEQYVELHKCYNEIVANNCLLFGADSIKAFGEDLIKFTDCEDRTL
ncbi:agip120 [Agrotis ipsilon multiple nucleopolyhedrovirus]|uniref:Uncharacterized protein n=1 Tax=Agrotis ipsilon multiple nucleopolyhedrovirus TaxID=208013 RepID=B6D634_9ABAC|nr:agip120 [Agrotis ipsilon multiple nucleopolyhedrovirus]ACI28821.1 unknown [Agrotis ipsilon multiple nucleopolyhedrovirus]